MYVTVQTLDFELARFVFAVYFSKNSKDKVLDFFSITFETTEKYITMTFEKYVFLSGIQRLMQLIFFYCEI